jgi:hypothetical protein
MSMDGPGARRDAARRYKEWLQLCDLFFRPGELSREQSMRSLDPFASDVMPPAFAIG